MSPGFASPPLRSATVLVEVARSGRMTVVGSVVELRDRPFVFYMLCLVRGVRRRGGMFRKSYSFPRQIGLKRRRLRRGRLHGVTRPPLLSRDCFDDRDGESVPRWYRKRQRPTAAHRRSSTCDHSVLEANRLREFASARQIPHLPEANRRRHRAWDFSADTQSLPRQNVCKPRGTTTRAN